MLSNPSTLDLEGVSFAFAGGLQALRDVTIHVGAGEIVSLVGPSGCGKSTLLNLVSGLLQPTSGTICLNGEVVADRRGRFGYMPQNDGLLAWRNSIDNASLLLEIEGKPRRAARSEAGSLLEKFGLAEFKQARPSQLSGGMRQRVALIRTVLPGRDVLLDEPFGALDAITRLRLQEWLLELQATTGLSMLLVTHDVEEALLLSDRVYVLSARPGTVVSVYEVPFSRPRTALLAAEADFARLKGALLNAMLASTSPNERTAA